MILAIDILLGILDLLGFKIWWDMYGRQARRRHRDIRIQRRWDRGRL